jgi:monofunctional biosynthetic peptidoglycan transglycosylase
MVTNPRYYQTHRYDRRLQRKASIILQRMRQADLPQPGE